MPARSSFEPFDTTLRRCAQKRRGQQRDKLQPCSSPGEKKKGGNLPPFFMGLLIVIVVIVLVVVIIVLVVLVPVVIVVVAIVVIAIVVIALIGARLGAL